jgi:hypothetical protein
VAFALALGALLLLPLIVAFYRSAQDGSSLGPRDRGAFTASKAFEENFFRVTDFVMPGKGRLQVSKVVDRLAKTPYVGWVALLLAALAVARRTRRARLWMAAAAIFFLLSLGMAIRLSESLGSSLPNNLLCILLGRVIGFSITSAPYRIHVLTLLCIGVLASMGVARYCASRPWIGLAAALLCVGETLFVSPAPFPLPLASARVSSVYDAVEQKDASGLLDLPAIRSGSQLVPGEYYYYQTRHRNGIPYLVGGVLDQRLAANPFFLEMWRLAAGKAPFAQDPLGAGRGLEHLAVLGYRHVVLHTSELSSEQAATARATLERWLGPPQAVDGSTLRYALPAVVSAPSP